MISWRCQWNKQSNSKVFRQQRNCRIILESNNILFTWLPKTKLIINRESERKPISYRNWKAKRPVQSDLSSLKMQKYTNICRQNQRKLYREELMVNQLDFCFLHRVISSSSNCDFFVVTHSFSSGKKPVFLDDADTHGETTWIKLLAPFVNFFFIWLWFCSSLWSCSLWSPEKKPVFLDDADERVCPGRPQAVLRYVLPSGLALGHRAWILSSITNKGVFNWKSKSFWNKNNKKSPLPLSGPGF